MTNTATAFQVRSAAHSVEVPDAEGRVYCRCSTDCTAATWNLFAQGHDARLVSRLADEVVQSRLTLDQAVELVRKAGGDERLVAKLVQVVGKAHDKWLKRQEAAERKARKAQPKVVRVRAKVGRWEYEGTVRDGVFTYKAKTGGNKATRKFTVL